MMCTVHRPESIATYRYIKCSYVILYYVKKWETQPSKHHSFQLSLQPARNPSRELSATLSFMRYFFRSSSQSMPKISPQFLNEVRVTKLLQSSGCVS